MTDDLHELIDRDDSFLLAFYIDVLTTEGEGDLENAVNRWVASGRKIVPAAQLDDLPF